MGRVAIENLGVHETEDDSAGSGDEVKLSKGGSRQQYFDGANDFEQDEVDIYNEQKVRRVWLLFQ